MAIRPRKPKVIPVTVGAGALSRDVVIPAGTLWVDVNPRTTTVTTQVSTEGGQANTVGNFFSLLNGQSYRFENPDGSEFDTFVLNFFAASAITVDVIYS